MSQGLNRVEPFAVGWFQRCDGMFQYSLRSRGEVDVSEVAKRFGGGGHVKAAGFVSAKPPWEIDGPQPDRTVEGRVRP